MQQMPSLSKQNCDLTKRLLHKMAEKVVTTAQEKTLETAWSKSFVKGKGTMARKLEQYTK
jgi:hypothetical protein